jgi:hypothetical protein
MIRWRFAAQAIKNMYKRFLMLFLLLSFTKTYVQAQEEEQKGFKFNNNFDLSLYAGPKQYGAALSAVHFVDVKPIKYFKFGYGIRLSTQFGNNLNYYTAPAILTSKQRGPQVFFSDTYPENIDTLSISSTQVNALNLSINLQYTIKQKLDIGFNIDAVGFSFGKGISGNYQSYKDLTNTSVQKAKPTTLNLLLISDNDIGTLNSELYFRYWVSNKIGLKLGATFLFTEYTTDNKLRLENDRWRNKSLMGLIGITFKPF